MTVLNRYESGGKIDVDQMHRRRESKDHQVDSTNSSKMLEQN